MKAIRGATTVKNDSPNEIRQAVTELLNEIVKKNNLSDDRIICILFSNTADITSFYPAKAAREAGFSNCALFSSAEPEIEGSLRRCIRVMFLCEGVGEQCAHVYLNDAAALRRDITKKFNIAVDGPAGSGKSTVSKIVGRKLNILCLDTGATYRACALACLNAKIDISDENAVKRALEGVKISVEYKNGEQITILDGENVSSKIRTPEISMAASSVSKFKSVRDRMVALQREIATNTSCILDGRDIGTNVLPEADFKFFLTASAEVRAKRRMDENAAKGITERFENVVKDIEERDKQDKTRLIAPLKQADDAILIDTTEKSIEEVVNAIVRVVEEKI